MGEKSDCPALQIHLQATDTRRVHLLCGQRASRAAGLPCRLASIQGHGLRVVGGRLAAERATTPSTVVEPSGASALASLLHHRDRFANKRVGVTLSGGNVSTERFAALMSGAEAAD